MERGLHVLIANLELVLASWVDLNVVVDIGVCQAISCLKSLSELKCNIEDIVKDTVKNKIIMSLEKKTNKWAKIKIVLKSLRNKWKVIYILTLHI